jgi:bidirectional [NiFe] hydrogenase diaphorase subunit
LRATSGKSSRSSRRKFTSACLSQRSDKVKAGIEQRIKEKGLENSCHVKGVGCMGLCAAGPLVSVEPEGKLYQGARPPEESSDTADIVDSRSIFKIQ